MVDSVSKEIYWILSNVLGSTVHQNYELFLSHDTHNIPINKGLVSKKS